MDSVSRMGVDGHLGDWSEGKTEDIHRSKVTAPCGKGGIPELLVLQSPVASSCLQFSTALSPGNKSLPSLSTYIDWFFREK